VQVCNFDRSYPTLPNGPTDASWLPYSQFVVGAPAGCRHRCLLAEQRGCVQLEGVEQPI
jgi:hypothetical protein